MEKSIVTFDLFVDESKEEMGISIDASLPVFEGEEAEKEMEELRVMLNKTGKKLADMFRKYRIKTVEPELPQDIEDQLKKAKVIGEVAKMLQGIAGDNISEDERKKLNAMIRLSEVASKLSDMN